MSADAVGSSLALAVEERSPARRACVVRLGGRSFAVDVVDAREVVVLDAITPVPGAPEPLVGVMNLRGTALPVIEARPLLGLRRPRRAARAGRGRRAIAGAAVLIEAVAVGLAGFDDVAPLAGTEGVPPALVRGRVTTESGETVTLLDGPALLAGGPARLESGSDIPDWTPRSLTMRRRTVLRLLSSASDSRRASVACALAPRGRSADERADQVDPAGRDARRQRARGPATDMRVGMSAAFKRHRRRSGARSSYRGAAGLLRRGQSRAAACTARTITVVGLDDNYEPMPLREEHDPAPGEGSRVLPVELRGHPDAHAGRCR